MKSKYNLTYILVDDNNFEIAYDIQKKQWPDESDYDGMYDKVKDKADDYCFFLVYDKDVLIGLVGLDLYDDYGYYDSIWLDWFTVLPQYRKNGYGEHILLDVIEYCIKLKKYKFLRLETTYYENRPALFLYDKVMHLKEEYTFEDTKTDKTNTLIYSYALHGPIEYWNNKPLKIREYYSKLGKNNT